jgi:two-component system, response regulator PdtaR
MLTALRIAVADDEPDMQAYFRKMLPRLGHEVVSVATNGRDLAADCLRLCPDLVITDHRMPDMNGIEAAQQIHCDLQIPVIVISAASDDELAAQVAAGNIMLHLLKPIKLADLEAAINFAVQRFEQISRAVAT